MRRQPALLVLRPELPQLLDVQALLPTAVAAEQRLLEQRQVEAAAHFQQALGRRVSEPHLLVLESLW